MSKAYSAELVQFKSKTFLAPFLFFGEQQVFLKTFNQPQDEYLNPSCKENRFACYSQVFQTCEGYLATAIPSLPPDSTVCTTTLLGFRGILDFKLC